MENKGTSRFDTGSLGGSQQGGRQGESQTGSAAGVVEKAKDMGQQAIDKAKDMGHQVADKARDLASSVSEQASQVAHKIGDRVTDTYESSRDYVTQKGFSGMADDLSDIVRRNPLPSLLIGLGIGFLLARALRED